MIEGDFPTAFACAALDRQIDPLVYDLYSLAPEEIEIVENKS
jgi:hypothetical protein